MFSRNYVFISPEARTATAIIPIKSELFIDSKGKEKLFSSVISRKTYLISNLREGIE